MKEISFLSPFPIEECLSRLEAVTEPDRGGLYEDLNRTQAVLARLKRRRVRLRVRRPFTRNALAPIFYGRLSAAPEGTLLRGRFRTHPAVIAFLGVWFTIFLLPGGWILVSNLDSIGFEIMMLPLQAGFFAALLYLLRRLARADQRDILQMIRHTLNATTVEVAA